MKTFGATTIGTFGATTIGMLGEVAEVMLIWMEAS